MVTFNVFGNCVSRDCLEPLINQNKARVLQYSGFINPISLFSEKGEFEMREEDLAEFEASNFHKRIFCQDVNKTTCEYMIERRADYIVIDLLGVRFEMLKKNNHYITAPLFYRSNKEALERKFGFDTYETIQFSDISDEVWIRSLDKLCNWILKNYPPSRIIFFQWFGVEDYIDAGVLKRFAGSWLYDTSKYNALVKRLNEYVEKKFFGCHIIRFPENVFADTSHKWGLHPLHYNALFYQYGVKAIETIVKNLSNKEEESILDESRQVCSDRFALLRRDVEVKSKTEQIIALESVLNFTRALSLDLFGDGKFVNNLKYMQKHNFKVAVLKTDDTTSEILLYMLKNYGIEVIFSTVAKNFQYMSDEDFEKCRQADIVISTDVYRKNFQFWGGYAEQF